MSLGAAYASEPSCDHINTQKSYTHNRYLDSYEDYCFCEGCQETVVKIACGHYSVVRIQVIKIDIPEYWHENGEPYIKEFTLNNPVFWDARGGYCSACWINLDAQGRKILFFYC